VESNHHHLWVRRQNADFCAHREALEEVGLNLNDKTQFLLLGRLNDVKVRIGFIVSPFVFLQISPQTPRIKQQVSEVSATLWVPFSFFKTTEVKALHLEISKAFKNQRIYPLHNSYFISISSFTKYKYG